MNFSLWKALLTAMILSPLLFPGRAFAMVASTEISLGARRIVEHALNKPATGIAFSLGEKINALEIQMKEKGIWGPWQEVRLDGDAQPWERDSSLLFADDATAVRMRSKESSSVLLHAISVEPDVTHTLEVAANRSLTPAPVIIPRW